MVGLLSIHTAIAVSIVHSSVCCTEIAVSIVHSSVCDVFLDSVNPVTVREQSVEVRGSSTTVSLTENAGPSHQSSSASTTVKPASNTNGQSYLFQHMNACFF